MADGAVAAVENVFEAEAVKVEDRSNGGDGLGLM